jgi:hypothetical protein
LKLVLLIVIARSLDELAKNLNSDQFNETLSCFGHDNLAFSQKRDVSTMNIKAIGKNLTKPISHPLISSIAD